jgi:protoporphyrinogen oxidase
VSPLSSDHHEIHADLAILGAGPAGLGAAYRAATAGFRVVVLEREDHVGGLAGSFRVAGVTVDHGSHRLHPSVEPRIFRELRSLLGDELQLRKRNGRIRLEGRWIAFPLQLVDLAINLPPAFLLAAGRDAALSWTRSPREDSFAEVLRASLGPTLSERFYFPYARKIWGLEPEEIAGEQARRRISAMSAGSLIKRLTRNNVEAGRVFWYPRKGFGQIWERLAEAAVAAGAELRLGDPVIRVELREDGFRVASPKGTVLAPKLWSTIPLPTLARLSDPPPPEEILAAAASLSSRSMILVYLVLPGRPYTPFDAHYLPEPGTPVTRISEPANYRDGDDPSDHTVLCAEIPCFAGDEIWCAGEDALVSLVVETLVGVGLPPAVPLASEVKRLSAAYPVYRRGSEQALRMLDAWTASLPGLLTFGRQGLHIHNNSHHALSMAWAAADALGADGSFDEASWAGSRAGFASHVVED